MKLLVCGGRDYRDAAFVNLVLLRLIITRGPIVEIIHGGALGADALASDFALRNGIPERVFMADWKNHGRSAGPRRNYQMLVDGKPDLVVAFPGGRGTANMMMQAKSACVEVLDVRAGPCD